MRSKNYKYYVHIYWDDYDKIFVAEVPELPGCATHGDTKEEAIRQAEDAIATWLDGAREIGKKIPEPLATQRFSGKFNLRVPPELHRKLVLKAKAFRKSLNSYVNELLLKVL